jgi:hypothetical protein
VRRKRSKPTSPSYHTSLRLQTRRIDHRERCVVLEMERKKKSKKGGAGKKATEAKYAPEKKRDSIFSSDAAQQEAESPRVEEEPTKEKGLTSPNDQAILQYSDYEFYSLSFEAYRNSLERSFVRSELIPHNTSDLLPRYCQSVKAI